MAQIDSVEITSCSFDDGPAIAHNNIASWWTDRGWVIQWGGKTCEYVTNQSARRMSYNLLTDRRLRRHQKAVRAGEIVGYARWTLPDEPVSDGVWVEARVASVSEERELAAKREHAEADWSYNDALDAVWEPGQAMKKRLTEGKRFLVLDYLAVHPNARRQGIATRLVESGIAEAKTMGLDIFVHAMKAGLGVYQRLGFVLLESVIVDDSKFGGPGEWGSYFLVKECKAGFIDATD